MARSNNKKIRRVGPYQVKVMGSAFYLCGKENPWSSGVGATGWSPSERVGNEIRFRKSGAARSGPSRWTGSGSRRSSTNHSIFPRIFP